MKQAEDTRQLKLVATALRKARAVEEHRAERKGRRKLTPSAVRYIRTSKEASHVLAAMFGVTAGSVLEARKGLTFKKHPTPPQKYNASTRTWEDGATLFNTEPTALRWAHPAESLDARKLVAHYEERLGRKLDTAELRMLVAPRQGAHETLRRYVAEYVNMKKL